MTRENRRAAIDIVHLFIVKSDAKQTNQPKVNRKETVTYSLRRPNVS